MDQLLQCVKDLKERNNSNNTTKGSNGNTGSSNGNTGSSNTSADSADATDASHKNYIFVKGSICDESLLERLFARFEFDCILHFAAQTHVDRSFANPGSFITTNILGTQAILERIIKVRPWNSILITE
jgi:UDP-glucose 4-epimerase